MRKSAKKFAAALLSAALVITSVNLPSVTTEAASKKVKLSPKKKTLYIGGTKKEKTVTLKLKKGKKVIKKGVKFTSNKKKVAKVNKRTGKVTAQKKGTAKITAKYKGKKYTCKITVKKKSAAKTSAAPGTQAPGTTGSAAPSGQPGTSSQPGGSSAPGESTAPGGSSAPGESTAPGQSSAPGESTAPSTDPSAEPSTDPSAKPTEAPDTEAIVTNASAIDPAEFTTTLTFGNKVTEDLLAGTKITLESIDAVLSVTVTAVFEELKADGTAVYRVEKEDQPSLKPTEEPAGANGEYKVISADPRLIIEEGVTTTYDEALVGNSISGFVVESDNNGGVVPVVGATVSVKGGQSRTTDDKGWYKVPATSGKKTVTVSGKGYLDETKTGIIVNRNNITAQNFYIEKYEEHKVYLDITVKDIDTKAPVVGAKVQVFDDATGELVWQTDWQGGADEAIYTSATGKAAVYNKDAVADGSLTEATGGNAGWGTKNGNFFKASSDGWQVSLKKDTTYTVKVSKPLFVQDRNDTATSIKPNLKDVYEEKEETITIGSTYKNEVSIELKKVAVTPSLTLKHTYADTTTAKTAGSAYNTYRLFAVYNGQARALTDESDSMKTVTLTNGVGNQNLLQVTVQDPLVTTPSSISLTGATLPTGTYYAVVKGYDSDTAADIGDPTKVVDAVAVAKFEVTAGTAAAAEVSITPGITRQFTTNVGLEKEEKSQQAVSAAGIDTLKYVTDNEGTLSTATDSAIKISNEIHQLFDDLYFPVGATDETEVLLTANGTYSMTCDYGHFLSGASYKVETASDYVVADDKTFSVGNIVNQDILIDATGIWNLDHIAVQVQDGDDLLGKDASAIKLKKFVIKDDATGDVVVEKDYGNTPLPQSNASISGSALTASTPGAFDTYLSYDVSEVAGTRHLKRGTYIVEVTLDGYETVSTAPTKTIGIESASFAVDAQVKANPDAGKEIVNVSVSIRREDNSIVDAATVHDSVSVILLNADNKIAGAAVTSAGAIKFTNGTNATIPKGNYKMIIRTGKAVTIATGASIYAETYAGDITVEEKGTVNATIELTEGGEGSIKVGVETTDSAEIDGTATFTAKDPYYVDVTAAGNWATVAYQTGFTTAISMNAEKYTGIRTASITDKEGYVSNLSEMEYTLTFNTNLHPERYSFYNKEYKVKLADKNQKVYKEYKFEYSNIGKNKVKLTIDHSGNGSTTSIDNGGDSKTLYGIIVKNAETGEVEWKDVYPGGSRANTTVEVTSGCIYIVEVYAMTGFYLSSKEHTVEKVATTVVMPNKQANSADD